MCRNGEIDLLKKLILQNAEEKNLDVNYMALVERTCIENHLDIFKFLWSKQMKKKNFQKKAFEKAYTHSSLGILEYLILDLKIEKTEAISKLLDKERKPTILAMFITRELKEQHASDLNTEQPSKNVERRPKI